MEDSRTAVTLNKSEQVARLLLERVIQSNLSPGSSIGTEAELLEQYAVSRPTLRESLRILESQGVLALRPGPRGGIMVSKPSIDVLAHALSVYLRLNDVPFLEILRARLAIEPALTYDAALNGTEAAFEEMERSIRRLEESDGDSEVIYKENRAFHSAIARAANNPVLEIFWSTISILASGEAAGLTYSDRNRRHIISAHRRVLDACRRHEPEVAKQLMVDHLGELEVLLQKRFKDRMEEPTRITFKSGRILG